MQRQSRRTQYASRPEGGARNVTSAVGMEETVGRLRARRSSLFTHTVIWVTGVICLALLLGTLVQAWSNSQLMQRVQAAQQQTQQLQSHHDNLVNLAKHYQDPSVIEAEAREQLGYIRPGEHAIVIVGATSQQQTKTPAHDSSSQQQGYWQAWWNAFFGR